MAHTAAAATCCNGVASVFTSPTRSLVVSLKRTADPTSHSSIGLAPGLLPTKVLVRGGAWKPATRVYGRGWEAKEGRGSGVAAAAAADGAASTSAAGEPLTAGSPAPALFDGTTRLYHARACPFAQRVVIAVNYKSLSHIELVEISLRSKPEWFAARVYPPGKVPALEHGGKVVGESLDLLLLMDELFKGQGEDIVPQDPYLSTAASVLVQRCSDVMMGGYTALSQLYKDGGEEQVEEAMGSHLDYLEHSLSLHSDKGAFFLGGFSYVDIAYLPFLERFRLTFDHFCRADITKGRPNLKKWFEAADVMPAYTSTRQEAAVTIATYKQMLDSKYFERAGVATASSSKSSMK